MLKTLNGRENTKCEIKWVGKHFKRPTGFESRARTFNCFVFPLFVNFKTVWIHTGGGGKRELLQEQSRLMLGQNSSFC